MISHWQPLSEKWSTAFSRCELLSPAKVLQRGCRVSGSDWSEGEKRYFQRKKPKKFTSSHDKIEFGMWTTRHVTIGVFLRVISMFPWWKSGQRTGVSGRSKCTTDGHLKMHHLWKADYILLWITQRRIYGKLKTFEITSKDNIHLFFFYLSNIYDDKLSLGRSFILPPSLVAQRLIWIFYPFFIQPN